MKVVSDERQWLGREGEGGGETIRLSFVVYSSVCQGGYMVKKETEY